MLVIPFPGTKVVPFRPKIRIMTITSPITVLHCIKEAGGMKAVTHPTWMDSTIAASTHHTLMVSTGTHGKGTVTRLRGLKWRLDHWEFSKQLHRGYFSWKKNRHLGVVYTKKLEILKINLFCCISTLTRFVAFAKILRLQTWDVYMACLDWVEQNWREMYPCSHVINLNVVCQVRVAR